MRDADSIEALSRDDIFGTTPMLVVLADVIGTERNSLRGRRLVVGSKSMRRKFGGIDSTTAGVEL